MHNEGPGRVPGPFSSGRSVLDRRDGRDANARLRDYEAVLQHLSLPVSRLDNYWALGLADRKQHTILWATCQMEMGNSLSPNPIGEGAVNIEQAIFDRQLRCKRREQLRSREKRDLAIRSLPDRSTG